MTDEELKLTIFRLLKKIAPNTEPEKLKPDDDIRHILEIDSFDALQLIVALGKHLSIETPEADYGKIATMKNLANYILLKKK